MATVVNGTVLSASSTSSTTADSSLIGVTALSALYSYGTSSVPTLYTVNSAINLALFGATFDAGSYSTLDLTSLLSLSLATNFTIGGAVPQEGSNGGTSGGTGFGTLELSSGFSVIAGSSITFVGTNDTLILGSGSVTPVPLTGFAYTDGVDFASIAYNASDTIVTSNNLIQVKNAGGSVIANINLSGSGTINPADLTIVNDATTLEVVFSVCFLRGTQLASLDGETPVEDLRLGDMVATRVDGTTVFQPVTWIGRRSVDVMSLGGNADGFPVRIRAGAFDENIPSRDLLVTQEHCIHIDGKLIPARMLVNGGSIVIDRDITQYEYFHVELEKHSILVAEGLETESYLDTGNRGNFANAPVPSLRPDLAVNAAHKSWEIDAAAPLATDPESVEPIWRALAERSAMSHATAHAVETTDEPDLTISIKGRSVRPIYADGGLYIFALPRGLTQTRLTSRSGAPSETRPWLNDRRRLGVKVQRITVRGAHEVRDVPLDHPGLSAGWWGIEQGDSGMLLRWTDGDAALPLPALKSMALLEIQVAATQTIVAETRRVA